MTSKFPIRAMSVQHIHWQVIRFAAERLFIFQHHASCFGVYLILLHPLATLLLR